MISATTIEAFEEEFHRYVDEYIREREEKNCKKTRRTILRCFVLVVLFLSMIFTCPDKQKHIEALNSLTSSMLNDQLSENSDGMEYFGALVGNKMLGVLLENSVYVDNYIIFSIGMMSYGGEDHFVSFGIFNHIFTKSRNQVRDTAKENSVAKKLVNFFKN